MSEIVNKKKVSKNRFKALFKGIPIPTYSWQKSDNDLILIDFNDAADRLTKGMMKNYVGLKASEMYKNQPEILEELYRCASDQINISREMKYNFMSTGEVKFLSVKYGFILPDLVIVHTEDITEKKEVYERLKKSESELKSLTKKLEQKISTSEEKYRTIFENTGTATTIIEEDTTISLVNEQFEELSGYSRKEIEGKMSWTEFVFKEDLERMKKFHDSRRKAPESTLKKYEFRFVNKKGTIRNVIGFIDMIPRTKKSVASLLDLTERKKADVEKQESFKNFIDLVNNSPDGIIIADENINHLFANQRAAEITGYNIDELVSMKGWELTRKEEVKVYKERMKKRLGSEPHKEIYERIIVRKDGSEVLTEFRTTTTLWHGKIVPMVVIRDITEKKKAELKLKENTEFIQNIFNAIQDGLSILDLDLNIVKVNPYMIDKYGSIDQIVNRKCYEVYQQRSSPCPWCPSIKTIETGQLHTSIVPYPTEENPTGWIELTAFPLKNFDGIVEGVIEYVKNITERKAAEEKLKDSEKKYREAYNRAEFYKDLFAHDINNILQSIFSGIQISQLHLDDPEKRDTLRRNAQIIKEQVIRGAKLVSNVRKLSQLEYPKRNLGKIEILNILAKVISNVKKSYKDKNINIRIDSVVEKVFTKANNFLEDVFENLLINGITHNRNSIVEIIVKILREQQNGINYVKMEFQDNGIGVADSMKRRIFIRGDRKEEIYLGMGLGLSLVRGIIESYNGEIWVEDVVKGDRSKGSNFVILIPEGD